MSVVARWWRGWVAFTSEREPAFLLAFFRIAIGLCAISSLVSAATSGVLDVMWVDASGGGALGLSGSRLVQLFGGATHPVIWGFFWVALAASVLSTVGLGGRLPLLVASQVYGALVRTNANTMGGYDSMIAIAFFLLFFSGANETLSLDAWRKTRRFATGALVSAWPRHVLVFQLVVIYFFTGLQKMSPVWTPAGGYSALYWVYQDPTWRRFDMDFTGALYPVLQVATAVTWHWELAAPLVLVWMWLRRTSDRGGRLRGWLLRRDLRAWYLTVGVLLHLGILVTLNVGPFSFVSLSFYPLFFRPDELTAFARRIRPSAAGSGSTKTLSPDPPPATS